jgi:hypothetical protein
MLPKGGIEEAPFIEGAPFLASMLPNGGLASMLPEGGASCFF